MKEGDSFVTKGVGFGTFSGGAIYPYLKSILPGILSKSLFSKYDTDQNIIDAGIDVINDQGRILDFDCVKQILSLDLLVKKKAIKDGDTVVVIGDGYGFTGSLIKSLFKGVKIIFVNLGRVLFFDCFYTEKVLPSEKAVIVSEKEELNNVPESGLAFLEAEKYEYLNGYSADLFINIASMQEMDPAIVNRYFSLMRSGSKTPFFYCCNRVEKQLPDGTNVKFNEYPWNEQDEILIDEQCPWYQKYPSNRPPFWKPFDGPIQHKLVKLKTV